MGIFGDIGRIAREVKNISDEYKGIKENVVSQTKDLAKQAADIEDVVKTGVKETIEGSKQHLSTKVTDAKDEVKKNISQ